MAVEHGMPGMKTARAPRPRRVRCAANLPSRFRLQRLRESRRSIRAWCSARARRIRWRLSSLISPATGVDSIFDSAGRQRADTAIIRSKSLRREMLSIVCCTPWPIDRLAASTKLPKTTPSVVSTVRDFCCHKAAKGKLTQIAKSHGIVHPAS